MAILSFSDRDTEALWEGQTPRSLTAIAKQARRKLDYIHAARELRDLLAPPGNRLEALRGDRAGQHSIRVNDQWRVCFRWRDGEGAYDVEIVDYH